MMSYRLLEAPSVRASARPKTWNKEEMIREIGQKINFSQEDSQKAVDAFTEFVSGAMSRGERVNLSNFGRFAPKKRAARIFKHPQYGRIRTDERVHPHFRAAPQLKHRVHIAHTGLPMSAYHVSAPPPPAEPFPLSGRGEDPFSWRHGAVESVLSRARDLLEERRRTHFYSKLDWMEERSSPTPHTRRRTGEHGRPS